MMLAEIIFPYPYWLNRIATYACLETIDRNRCKNLERVLPT